MHTENFQLLAAHCWPLAALSSTYSATFGTYTAQQVLTGPHSTYSALSGTYSPPSSCATEQGSMGKAVITAAILCVMSIYWGSCNGIAWCSQHQAQFCDHTASLVLQDILSKPTVTLHTNTQLWASLSCLTHFLSIWRYEMLGQQLKCWNKTEFQISVSLMCLRHNTVVMCNVSHSWTVVSDIWSKFNVYYNNFILIRSSSIVIVKFISLRTLKSNGMLPFRLHKLKY